MQSLIRRVIVDQSRCPTTTMMRIAVPSWQGHLSSSRSLLSRLAVVGPGGGGGSIRAFSQTPVTAMSRTNPFKQHKKGGMKFWRFMSYFVCLPGILVMSFSVFSHMQHEHECGGPERPPFVAYDYLRIRTKKFPWGDGNHSLFHNPKVNALPGGYEDEDGEE